METRLDDVRRTFQRVLAYENSFFSLLDDKRLKGMTAAVQIETLYSFDVSRLFEGVLSEIERRWAC